MDKIIKNLVDTLNKRMINPEKDTDLFLEELNNIGLFFNEENNWWYYDNE
jgi:hypothetical protein